MPSLIDFARIGAPVAIEALDYEAQLVAARDKLVEILPEWDVSAIESDPANKVLEVAAYLDLLLRGRVNDAIKSMLLAYATGTDLDQLAANRQITRLTDENDSRLRDRVQQAFWLPAAAGPAGTYRAYAFGVSTDVIDAHVVSPSPGRVDVVVLASEYAELAADDPAHLAAVAIMPDLPAQIDGASPPLRVIVASQSSATHDAVRAALSADDVVPITDSVYVLAPQVVQVPIIAELTLYAGPDAALVLADAQAALDAYLMSIRKIGYDITRAGVLDALVVPGVQNVALAMDDTTASDYQIIAATPVALTVAMTRNA